MRCVLALVLLPGLCLGSGLDEVERRFSPGSYGLAPQEITEFRTVQDISSGISRNRGKVFSAYDASYVAGVTAVEYFTLAKVGGAVLRRARSLPLGPVSGFAGPLARSVVSQVPSMSRLLRYIVAEEKQAKPASYLVLRALWDRPTPTGLAVASGECIRIALEDYAFALDNGVDVSNQFMQAAGGNITDALELYAGYTGLVDAEAISLTGESPEGFGRLTGLCSSAVENIEAAFSSAKKERAAGAVVVS